MIHCCSGNRESFFGRSPHQQQRQGEDGAESLCINQTDYDDFPSVASCVLHDATRGGDDGMSNEREAAVAEPACTGSGDGEWVSGCERVAQAHTHMQTRSVCTKKLDLKGLNERTGSNTSSSSQHHRHERDDATATTTRRTFTSHE